MPCISTFLGVPRSLRIAVSSALRERTGAEEGAGMPHPAALGKAGCKPLFVRMLIWTAKTVLFVHVAFMLTTSAMILCYRFIDPAVTVLALTRKYADGWSIARPQPADLARVSRTARRMVIAVEDAKFYEHHGFDLEAFKRAAAVNRQLGEPLYGGSTLTMQLARTLFLVPVKSYVRKYLELIIALELELFLGKDRILELYLSWAEWGKGIFGIEAASKAYFKTGSAQLGVSQAARLVAMLSSPIRYGPYDVEKRAILKSRYAFLMGKFGT